MKLLIDTSSVFKLYYKEEGTNQLDEIFNNNHISEVYLSEITKIEFYSAVHKKQRTKVISAEQVKLLINNFNADLNNYSFIPVSSQIVDLSQYLLDKYGSQGLRALDPIQFASVYSIREVISIAATADKLLNDFFQAEGISTLSP